ncbi:MAG: type II secretion system protein GspE [Elusimicrobia bacterium]|nr:MAG: type II secretion system protein GspE [Elusimicrobiota bacterium]
MPPQSMKLGDILIQAQVVTLEQLDAAQKMAQSSNVRLGEAIAKLGFATEEAIAIAVSKLLGVPYASRENKILKPEKNQDLDKLIDENFARENVLLPLFVDEGILAIALAEPDNVLIMENLKLMTGFEPQPFISTKAQIMKAIDEFYGNSGSFIDTVMEQADPDDDADSPDIDVSGARLDLDKVTAAAKGVKVVSYVNAILKQAIAERCSDIHIECYDERVVLRFRIHGTLYEKTPPSKEQFNGVVSRIKILSKLDIAEKRLPQDGSFSFQLQNRVIDMRVSICPTVFGEKVVMRVLDKGAVQLKMENLKFEPRQHKDFMKAAESPHGLIFLTGPTGSGKTTTLYTVLNTIKSPELNFMTAEDPVEFKLEGINQVQMQSKIGLTFASALRSFLRQDPDVILVGEVRDQETAETCLRAALTGHLVLSTLHTNSALEAIIRLGDMGIEPFMLGSSLRLIAAQRLSKTLCTACKTGYKPPQKEIDMCMKECMLNPLPDANQLTFYKEVGCDKCTQTGFTGRTPLYEIYYITPALRNGIYKQKDILELQEIVKSEGMWNMRASGWRKVIEGVTTTGEILSITMGE